MLPWKSVNIASSQLSRRLSLRFKKVPILRKQQSADMRKSLSTWISGIRRFLFKHRALTCLSKSLAHILQRELYPMANTSLLRHEAEMTLLQPQLGETRGQELRNSSFWDPSLFESQLVKEGEDFLLKKGTSKDSQGFAPYQNKPFRGPHKKRGSYRKRPYGGNSSQSSNQSFSSGRGKPNFRGSTIGEGGVETPLPNDSSKASLSPPVGETGKQTNVLKTC